MPRLLLFHLLGVCLLLNQIFRPVAANEKDDVIKVCGRELVRAQIDACGTSTVGKRVLSRQDATPQPKLVTEIVPSFNSKDTETINMMSELIANLPQELKAAPSGRQSLLPELQQRVPILKDSDLSSEEFKKIIHNRQSEAADSSPSELKYLGLHAHSRRKRQFSLALYDQCCLIGCTKRALAVFC
ncbi:prorelaxin H1 [Saimiri boliviensis]|uniref:Insulin-like domain-containing protein n=1 Tax=Saimiri boliviensis boliviensis TaxID=39432 RepID=A0A2K6S6P3_SAIBB|nr:prorelaxin H1 [Saimiri boliviensis boliviensis]